MPTLDDVQQLAAIAHMGQVDKIGIPYVEHVRAVAAGLVTFDPEVQMAGLLHDVLEDTDLTAADLRKSGIPEHVINTVMLVTRHPADMYSDTLRMIISSHDATLVKIADNAHNSHPDRAAQLPAEKREKLAERYARAREVLWPAVDPKDVEAIVSIVNPALLSELREKTALVWA
ncbi:HD domain-containing protein [Streptomyces sp. NPDC088752]|uniref:HD domain-containing protein n=1 Tax=Streptomyces sp. NPDC088752 TaxID=3154963 RepID=UPI00341AE5BF